MIALFGNAEFWVAVGLLLFFGLIAFLKVPNAAARALDDRGRKIQAALDEAEALRAEAQKLLDGLKSRRIEAEAEAARMLQDAEVQARRLEADAKTRLDEQIARRTDMAERRIAMAEQQAAAEVRRAAAELAAAAAEQMLATRLAGRGSDPLADRAIASLPSLQ